MPSHTWWQHRAWCGITPRALCSLWRCNTTEIRSPTQDDRSHGEGVLLLGVHPGCLHPRENSPWDGHSAKAEIAGLNQCWGPLHNSPETRAIAIGQSKPGITRRNARCLEGGARGAQGHGESSKAKPELGRRRLPVRRTEGTRKRKGQEQERKAGQRKRERRSKQGTRRRWCQEEQLEAVEEKTPVVGDVEYVKGGVADPLLGLTEAVQVSPSTGSKPGGAGKEQILWPGPSEGAEPDLRSGISLILAEKFQESLSLRSLGPMLLQCFMFCCKPLYSTGGFPIFGKDEVPSVCAEQLDPELASWESAVLLALTHMSGNEPLRQPGLFGEPGVKRCVHEQLTRFDVWDETNEVMSFEKFFTAKSLDYCGEEIKLAQELNWRAVANSLPDGVGQLDLLEFCTLGTKAYVECFESFLLPPELQVWSKPPRVMVIDGGWGELCEGLLAKGICSVFPLDKIYKVQEKPLLNGLFAVGKNEYVDGPETQRLIMNLTPVNSLMRELKGDVATLPSLANMSLLTLGPQEVCLVSSEDVRCFFYLFRIPQDWKKYMGFNCKVPERLVPPGFGEGPCVLVSNVLPMGFASSVSIAQHVRRNVVRWSAQSLKEGLGGEGEIRRDKGFPRKTDLFRVYLDNFDQLEVCDKALAQHIAGTTSSQVERLRETYEEMGLPRHPKKAVARQVRAEVQGSLILGDEGIAIPKPQKILQYLWLGLQVLAQGECKLKELQVVLGGFVYFTSFRRPLLSCLNESWRFVEELKSFPPVVRLPLPNKVVVELVRFLCLIPLAQMSFRPSFSPTVTCSDASMTGGGICMSKGLTPYGAMASRAPVRGDIPEEHDFVQVLSVGLFDGISGLRVACDTLGLPMAGHISVEQDPQARRVVESYFPDTIFHDDVRALNEEMVQGFALRFPQVGVVILGAGPPCQGVSGLNSDRRGALKDDRSSLFAEIPRILEMFGRHFFWAQVHFLKESVASMDLQDKAIMSKSVQTSAWRIDSSGLTLCRRPRLYWISWEIQQTEDMVFQDAPEGDEWSKGGVAFSRVCNEKALLEPGWSMAGDSLPTFTTARPAPVPGRKPAGLNSCTKEELLLWESEQHRFPPYQYQRRSGLVNRKGDWRVPSVAEREALMGFPVGYTKMCLPKKLQKGWDFENVRMSLLGNSWQVGVIAWLLAQLFRPLGLTNLFTPKEIAQQLTPGASSTLQGMMLRPPLGPQRQKTPCQGESDLISKITGIASMKGEDLLLQASTEQSVKFHRLRASIPSRLWKWGEVAGWGWKHLGEHINILEMRAVLTTINWWIRKKRAQSQRFLHLVDSLVVLRALSRGRTSSRKLRRTTMRINSLLLGADLHPLWGYVHTSQNPADRPSRRGMRVKKRWVKWNNMLRAAPNKSEQKCVKA